MEEEIIREKVSMHCSSTVKIRAITLLVQTRAHESNLTPLLGGWEDWVIPSQHGTQGTEGCRTLVLLCQCLHQA